MQERDAIDLFLVAVLAVLVYVESFGLADPLATADEVASMLVAMDVRVYLLLAAVSGCAYVGYLTIYLPRKDASRSAR